MATFTSKEWLHEREKFKGKKKKESKHCLIMIIILSLISQQLYNISFVFIPCNVARFTLFSETFSGQSVRI